MAKSSSKQPKKQKATPKTNRISVSKTYKLYINGAFPRSEQGRYLPLHDKKGEFVANYSWASRKDFRNSLVAARKAQQAWASRSAFNRSQIMFRMAEMIESRRHLFEKQLIQVLNYSPEEAEKEVDTAIDRLFWYAGWADKYTQVLSSVNPISSPYFNFTIPEPTGTVAIFAPQNSPLVGLVSSFAPVILSGNTCVLIVENVLPIMAIELAEALATSDLPNGVVNILTGKRDELLPHVAEHMDLNAISCYGGSEEFRKTIQIGATHNVKRVSFHDDPPASEWFDDSQQSLYAIVPFIEWKTAWHPIGL